MKYAALNRRHRKKRRGCNANKPKSENAVVVDESNNNDVDIDAKSSVHTNTVNSSAPINNVNTDTVSATPDVSSSGDPTCLRSSSHHHRQFNNGCPKAFCRRKWQNIGGTT